MSVRATTTGALREGARAGQLIIRRADAGARALPDFVIIGAQKSGTTSLYAYLVQHPDVVAAARKEVHYFDTHYDRGERWYRAMFPRRSRLRRSRSGRGARAITGEASPYYLFHPLVPPRAAALIPDARLIVVLRDPVERAWSHYRHEVAAGRERLSFAEAVDAEADRLAGSVAAIRAGRSDESVERHRTASYCARGRYARQLQQWFEHYPRESVHVVVADDLFAEPGKAFAGVAQFLDLDEAFAPRFEVRNAGSGAALDAAMAHRLGVRFREDNADLEQLLGRRLGWTGMNGAGRRSG